MAIYELTLRTRYAEQECINRFNYVSTGVGAAVTGSFALWSAFTGATNLPPPAEPFDSLAPMFPLWSFLSSAVTFEDVTVFNVYDPTDFYASGFVADPVGQAVGEGLSPATAYGFVSSRNRRDVSRATKRFVGVVEGSVGNLGQLTTAGNNAMDAIASALSQVLNYNDEGETFQFTPAVCGKESYPSNPAKPDRVAYRYYPTEAEQLTRTMVGITWTPYRQTRTQTSRQYGRGR